MSNHPVRAATDPDPYGWRAGTVRVGANALLVLLVFAVVTVAAGVAQMLVLGAPPPTMSPGEVALLVAALILVRWIVVLPGLLLVLVGIEYVARRAPYARVLTAVIAFAPLALWELTQSGDTSAQGLILGLTAVLFAVVARLPARFQGRSTDDHAAAQPAAETTVAPR